MNLRHIRILKVCMILVLLFSIFPEAVFSQEDSYKQVGIGSTSLEGTKSCNEHNCPVLPDAPFHHCAVCCVISHFFISQFTDVNFHFDNSPQAYSMDEGVLHKELFVKTLFRPPQLIL